MTFALLSSRAKHGLLLTILLLLLLSINPYKQPSLPQIYMDGNILPNNSFRLLGLPFTNYLSFLKFATVLLYVIQSSIIIMTCVFGISWVFPCNKVLILYWVITQFYSCFDQRSISMNNFEM